MKKILFFIGSLATGGKERRLVELLSFLKNECEYEMLVVVSNDQIDFPSFLKLNIPVIRVGRHRVLGSILHPFKLLSILVKFDPDLVHTWGRMQTFYMLLTRVGFKKIPLINGQITNASPNISFPERIVDFLNFRFSDIILSNSYAGIEIYQPPAKKSKVIYNGLNLGRFVRLTPERDIKLRYGIKTEYAIVMVANVSENKDYERFFNVGKEVVTVRNDVSFVGVGYFEEDSSLYVKCHQIIDGDPRLIMTGQVSDVESLINACDVGVLFSNIKIHGEGISNSVLEYMALSKPVVANDAGGTKEVVKTGENGYLVTNDSTIEEIASLILHLLNHPQERVEMGKRGRERIESAFTVESMGNNFVEIYGELLGRICRHEDIN